MNNISLPLENVAVKLATDKTRRKRLKVISACCECRRKKTKCNGEKPCIGCIKTNVECKYANNNPQIQPPQPQPQQQHQHQQHIIKTKTTHPIMTDINKVTLQSIEQRLGAIEDILHLLLQQQPRHMNSGYHSGAFDGKRKHEEMEDYVRLPPPLNYPESSSSSSVSSTSPKLNTIQNLLNEEKQHRPSAFYRLTAGSDLRSNTLYY